MDLFSILDCFTKKGRVHRHRYGKKRGDKEYYIGNELKQKFKKKNFQEVHDGFVRDEQFRSRMIQIDIEDQNTILELSGRVQELQYNWNWSNRRCLSTNGWFLGTRIISTIWPLKKLTITKVTGGSFQTKMVPIPCQSGTGLISNKHCLPCGNWKKNRKKLNETHDRHKVILRLGGVGKDHGELFVSINVSWKMNKVLIEQGNLLWQVIGKFFKHDFLEFICFLIVTSCTADAELLSPTGCVKTTPQMTFFLRCKNVQKIVTGKKRRSIHTAWQQLQEWMKDF